MRCLRGVLALTIATLLGTATPASASGDVDIDWGRTPPASGRVIGGDAVVMAGEAGGSFPLAIIDDPPVGPPGYQIVGEISYSGVQGRGYVEMWTVFDDGSRFFSRTLAQDGPGAAITGTSDRRDFVLPFNLDEASSPVRLEIGIVLPGSGTVRIGPLHLVGLGEGAGEQGWWSDRTGGVAGAALGATLGILGAVIGSLSSRGRARSFVLWTMTALLVAGCGLLAAGVVALARAQPYAVYFPLLLGGVIMAGVFGGGIRTARRTYAEAELRKMRAMDAA